MAIDTDQKRASISSGLAWEENGWPDNTVGPEDRAQLSGLYAGLDYTAVVPPTPPTADYVFPVTPRGVITLAAASTGTRTLNAASRGTLTMEVP